MRDIVMDDDEPDHVLHVRMYYQEGKDIWLDIPLSTFYHLFNITTFWEDDMMGTNEDVLKAINSYK